MTNLPDRIEQADESQQRELLVEAWKALGREMPKIAWNNVHDHAYRTGGDEVLLFYRKLDAEAFVDAALMLVPEGWSVNIIRTADSQFGNCNLYWFKGGNRIPAKKCHGAGQTPALAIAAAALRAHTKAGDDSHG